MPNRIVDVFDALNAGVASGEDFFVTVMDDRGGTGTFARDNWESLRSFCDGPQTRDDLARSGTRCDLRQFPVFSRGKDRSLACGSHRTAKKA